MKRLVLLLTLFLIWPLAVCAQMVTPGGGTNIYGNVGIVGGTCQLPMSMNGIDQLGNIACQAPAVNTGATAPTNPVNGQQWFDTTNNTLNIWNGTAWVPISGAGGAFTPPDGSTWTAAGLTGLASLGVNGNTTIGGTLTVTGTTTLGATNVTSLLFNGVPMGGTCAANEFVNALSATGIPTCALVTGGGGAATIVSPTPPPSPVNGQMWFNTTDLQTYIWYNDGTSSQWVPVVNVGGSGGAIPPSGSTIDTPTFTGTSTFNGPAVFNSTTNFVGTMTFPDGSYYDTNGHEVMKNLGVGVVARTDGTNGTSGNSITVVNSGWGNNGVLPNNDPDAWWDAMGINRLQNIEFEWPTVPVPDVTNGYDLSSSGGEMAVYTDPNNNATGNPISDYALYNPSTYTGGVDTGYEQYLQAEGLEFINSIGIHTGTWQNSPLGCTMDAMLQGECAIAAYASTERNNLNYGIRVGNGSNGNAAQTSLILQNNIPHTAGIYLTGQNFTPAASAQPDQLIISTSALNGVAIEPFLVFEVPPANTPTQVFFGSVTTPGASFSSYGAGTLELAAGAHVSGPSTHTADAPIATIATHEASGTMGFYINTGLTVGSTFTPNLIGYFGPAGLNVIGNGTYAALNLNGNPVITNEVAFTAAVSGQVSGNCTAITNNGIASRVGNHVTLQLTYQATCTAMGGWLQIHGFPWVNSNNTAAYCTLETGGMPFDTDYWPADCRLLPGWEGCIPVEIGSNVLPQYYNSGLIPPGQEILLNMTCNYITDSMSP